MIQKELNVIPQAIPRDLVGGLQEPYGGHRPIRRTEHASIRRVDDGPAVDLVPYLDEGVTTPLRGQDLGDARRDADGEELGSQNRASRQAMTGLARKVTPQVIGRVETPGAPACPNNFS